MCGFTDRARDNINQQQSLRCYWVLCEFAVFFFFFKLALKLAVNICNFFQENILFYYVISIYIYLRSWKRWSKYRNRVSILLSNLTGRDGDELAVQRCKRQLVAYIIPPVGKQEGEGNSEDHVSFIISVVMMGWKWVQGTFNQILMFFHHDSMLRCPLKPTLFCYVCLFCVCLQCCWSSFRTCGFVLRHVKRIGWL